jgi:hypothetical protein
MGAQGTATLDFGAYPGITDAEVAVTGQAGIVSGSLVEAWVRPVATGDHSVDEHMVDPPRVIAGNIVAATGFTIYGFAQGNDFAFDIKQGSQSVGMLAEDSTTQNWRAYGQWTIAWAWN